MAKRDKATARKLIRERKAANRKRTINDHVKAVAKTSEARKAVAAALRKAAKTLRESGALGRVQTRIGRVAEGVIGRVYAYTAQQIAVIATTYRPRKVEYREVRAALLAA